MKIKKTPFIILGGVLLLLLFLTLSCTCLGGKEGFGLDQDDDNSSVNMLTKEEEEEEEEKDGFGLGPDDDADPDDDTDENSLVNMFTKEEEEKEGFEGSMPRLHPENSTSAEKMLDIFSQVHGDVSCGPVSSQLHNSRGGLCLTTDQQFILQSRGGNATSGDSQIGF